jgi:hypothetical protein
MLSIAVSQERLEADLAAGRVGCPDCSGRLSPWGFARSRKDLVGTTGRAG